MEDNHIETYYHKPNIFDKLYRYYYRHIFNAKRASKNTLKKYPDLGAPISSSKVEDTELEIIKRQKALYMRAWRADEEYLNKLRSDKENCLESVRKLREERNILECELNQKIDHVQGEYQQKSENIDTNKNVDVDKLKNEISTLQMREREIVSNINEGLSCDQYPELKKIQGQKQLIADNLFKLRQEYKDSLTRPGNTPKTKSAFLNAVESAIDVNDLEKHKLLCFFILMIDYALAYSFFSDIFRGVPGFFGIAASYFLPLGITLVALIFSHNLVESYKSLNIGSANSGARIVQFFTWLIFTMAIFLAVGIFRLVYVLSAPITEQVPELILWFVFVCFVVSLGVITKSDDTGDLLKEVLSPVFFILTTIPWPLAKFFNWIIPKSEDVGRKVLKGKIKTLENDYDLNSRRLKKEAEKITNSIKSEINSKQGDLNRLYKEQAKLKNIAGASLGGNISAIVNGGNSKSKKYSDLKRIYEKNERMLFVIMRNVYRQEIRVFALQQGCNQLISTKR